MRTVGETLMAVSERSRTPELDPPDYAIPLHETPRLDGLAVHTTIREFGLGDQAPM
jgi:hypothetical protein